MTRLEVPLIGRKVHATGWISSSRVDLWLRDTNDVLKLVTFRLDSATDMSTVPATSGQAVQPALTEKPGAQPHSLEGPGSAKRPCPPRISGMDDTEYTFPCYFLGDPPNAPLDPAQPPCWPGISGPHGGCR